MPVLVRSFSYTPHARFSEVFKRGVSFAGHRAQSVVLVRTLSCTPDAGFSEGFLLPPLMPFLVTSFSYSPLAASV